VPVAHKRPGDSHDGREPDFGSLADAAAPAVPGAIPGVQARRRFLQIIGASAAGITTMGGVQTRTLNGSNETGYWNAVENSFTLICT
jgi:hypothetical protein